MNKALADHAQGMQARLEAIRDRVDPLVWEEFHGLRLMLSNLAADLPQEHEFRIPPPAIPEPPIQQQMPDEE